MQRNNKLAAFPYSTNSEAFVEDNSFRGIGSTHDLVTKVGFQMAGFYWTHLWEERAAERSGKHQASTDQEHLHGSVQPWVPTAENDLVMDKINVSWIGFS